MIWVGIVGAKGHVGEALTRLVAGHPGAQISSFVNTGEFTGEGISMLEYRSMLDAIQKSDIIFNGLTGSAAGDIFSEALVKGKRIIDISEEAYNRGNILSGSVYGLPELYRSKVENATIVSNPSCYCTGAMLALAPLMSSELIDAGSVVIESKSGITGLRSTDKLKGTEVLNEGGHRVYKLDNRNYSVEIEEQLKVLFGKSTAISYTSYINGIRGIVMKIYSNPVVPLNDGDAEELYKQFYRNSPFVKICSEGGLNSGGSSRSFCEIEARVDKLTGKLVVTTAMESPVRTQTEQAVQTMNLMYGLDEKTGLQYVI